MNRHSRINYPVSVAGTDGPASIRLDLANATLYDPNNTVTSAVKDALGGYAVTVTGGRASDDPGAAATWIWGIKTPADLAPDAETRWSLRTLLTMLRYPAQKFVGDTWIRMGICTRNDPNGAAWSARGYGWKWLTAAGAPRVEEFTVTAGGAPVMVSPTTAQYAARAIEQTFHRAGTGQAILPIAAMIVDGSNQRTGTDLTTTNLLLTLGAGVELGIFVSIGRSVATGNGANPDTVYFQADTQEVVEWNAATGYMDARRIVNFLAVGTSLTVGTGWNYDSNGELFGYRRKYEDAHVSDPAGLGMLRYHGSQGGGVNNGHMLLGRHIHEGHSGFTAAQLDTAMTGYLDALTVPMQIVCFDGLTNSAQNGVAAATAIASIQSAVNKMRAHANVGASAKLILWNVPPLANTTHETTAATYRALLSSVTGVDAILDTVTGIVPGTHMSDGVHFNSAGYDIITARLLAITRLY